MEKYRREEEDLYFPVHRPTDTMQPYERFSIGHFVRNTLWSILICLALYVFLRPANISHKYATMENQNQSPIAFTDDNAGRDPNPASNKVPVEAHIMSQCPDAKNCFVDLIMPAMVKMHQKVDFKLSFIGDVSDTTPDVSCKHGPSECIGNMLMLCAENMPFDGESDNPRKMPTVRSLGFANCLLNKYENIPDRALVQDCALEHGIDFQQLNKCASSQDDRANAAAFESAGRKGELSGIALLRESVQRSKDAGVTKSCTVRVDEKVWCILDGGEWKECQKPGAETVDGLVAEVNRLYAERN